MMIFGLRLATIRCVLIHYGSSFWVKIMQTDLICLKLDRFPKISENVLFLRDIVNHVLLPRYCT